ncbi:MAG: Tim44 domain-containing protein [Gemmatimonadaceae bacterium]|nr:Tim44 domain-containing protein [Acetobacteraceae bacterium]
MRTIDRNFDPQHFLNGAEAAFRMIVGAFAAGDRTVLRPLLSDDTYRSFESAITGRETAEETQRSEIRSIEGLTIEDAALSGTMAAITLRIVSDQVAETLGRDGRPVAGADAVAELTDIWTFERDLAQPDPAWRLSAARSG